MSNNELFTALVRGGFIIYLDGQLVVTNKFFRAFAIPLIPDPVQEVQEVPRETLKQKSTQLIKAQTPLTPAECFPSPLKNFIMDCQVPAKIPTRDGFFWANRYSTPAEKVLTKILQQGYQYDILVAATKLYYKAGGARKAISNYLIEGTWQSFYDDMATSLKDGTVHKHIDKSINKEDEDGYSRYKK